MVSKAKILECLESSASAIPANVYWLDADNIFLGANNSAMKSIGCISPCDLIGKTLYDFYHQEIADKIAQNHSEVMQIGKELKYKEVIKDITTGKTRYFTTVIAPLRNEAGKIIGTIGASIDVSAEKKEEGQLKIAKIFEHLEKVAQNIPIPFYWLDLNQEYLGVNKHGLRVTGTRSYEEDFAGKTPRDLYPKEMAEDIVRHHKEAIQTKEILLAEELIKDVVTGQVKYFNAFIAPLFDDENKVIGTIGTSIETTAEKEAASLKLINELQKTKLEEQGKFKKIADQVVHDVRSPLASLLMILKSCEKNIPERTRIALREAATGIGDIANNLLCKYEKDEPKAFATEGRQPIMVSLVLLQLLSEKKHQYKELPIKFTHDFCQECNFIFIKAEFTHFKRMMSNLVNNAVDASDGKKGKVGLKLNMDDNRVKIVIQDNGKGMSQEVIDKIMSNIAVTDDKKDGHGIGFVQIRETLQRNQGKFEINSKIGAGTEITITFPLVVSPGWIAEEIKLNKGDTVVILDDDNSIHGAWDTRFKDYKKEVYLKHFTSGKETIDFINDFPEKEEILLLTDFELLKQELNGINVIEKTNTKRSILVTSHYTNLVIRDLAIKNRTKILPKPLASEIPIKILRKERSKKNDKKAVNNSKKIDLVIIDDDQMFADSLTDLFQSKDLAVDTYYSPKRFLENLSQYTKDTKICMDNDFRSQINGIELAKQLNEAGYTNLYILSGKDFDKNEIPNYLIVLLKGDMSSLDKLL